MTLLVGIASFCIGGIVGIFLACLVIEGKDEERKDSDG